MHHAHHPLRSTPNWALKKKPPDWVIEFYYYEEETRERENSRAQPLGRAKSYLAKHVEQNGYNIDEFSADLNSNYIDFLKNGLELFSPAHNFLVFDW